MLYTLGIVVYIGLAILVYGAELAMYARKSRAQRSCEDYNTDRQYIVLSLLIPLGPLVHCILLYSCGDFKYGFVFTYNQYMSNDWKGFEK